MCNVGMCFMLAERVVAHGKKHIVAAVGGCRKPLVSIEWAVSHLFCTNGLRECYYHFVQAPLQKWSLYKVVVAFSKPICANLIVGILQIFELLISIN